MRIVTRWQVSSYAQTEENTDSRRVKKIYEYINIHYQDEIRLEELANIAGNDAGGF